MRAVSSPSLTENPSETAKIMKKSQNDENTMSHNNNNIHQHQPSSQHSSASVLQKFKKTFSNLKGKSSSIQSNQPTTHSSAPLSNGNNGLSMVAGGDSAGDATKYRFGPLVWRSSKERRKTKHHRRDKCNSGDSGIHVELENDDNNAGNDVTDSMDTSLSFNVRVRRANSAKVTSSTLASTVKARALRKTEMLERNYSPLPSRSLSQPFGLNQGKLIRFFRHTTKMNLMKMHCRRWRQWHRQRIDHNGSCQFESNGVRGSFVQFQSRWRRRIESGAGCNGRSDAHRIGTVVVGTHQARCNPIKPNKSAIGRLVSTRLCQGEFVGPSLCVGPSLFSLHRTYSQTIRCTL